MTIEARNGLFKAVPLDIAADPAKLAYILDRLVERDSEWSGFQTDKQVRRRIASSYIAEAIVGKIVVLEVWQLDTPQLVGLVGFTNISVDVDAEFHPTFFDGKLKNGFGKRELLLRAMDWAFGTFRLNRLSLAVPEDRYGLVRFARTKLGFRFEGENRTIHQQRAVYRSQLHGEFPTRKVVALTPSAREAELGSRKYQAVRRDGEWVDLILMSVTRAEFGDFIRKASPCPISSADQSLDSQSPKTSVG